MTHGPRILVIDDLAGRSCLGKNRERVSLCRHLQLRDVSSDVQHPAEEARERKLIAEAVFVRAQLPVRARVGDTVENDLPGALEAVRAGWPQSGSASVARRWSLVLLDLCFYTGEVRAGGSDLGDDVPVGRPRDSDPGSYFGLEILDALQRDFPDLPVIMLSSMPREPVSREFTDRGALGFIDRTDLEAWRLLSDAIWKHGLIEDEARELVGQSLNALLVLREARRSSLQRDNVLIRGERGTGKDILAAYIHRKSDERSAAGPTPFVAVNSAVLSSTLFAAEMFGVAPRAATGVEAKLGLIERAHRGDLFLDEIADMPLEAQAGLLRVLQDRRVTRVGGHEAREVDVRFLSATNADLETDTVGLREDLVDRLRVGATITLPPLRERLEDLPPLVEKFVRDAEAQFDGIRRREVSEDVLARLAEHGWPGNVRELRTVIYRAVGRNPDVDYLVPGHLRFDPPRPGSLVQSSPAAPWPLESSHGASSIAKLGSALAPIAEADPRAEEPNSWVGKLDDVVRQQARANARLLLAALQATKRRSTEHPEGVVQFHPAVKLLKNDANLKAPKAADIVKSLLTPIADELVGDLKEAYERALRLRPKNPKKNRAASARSQRS